MLNTGTHLLAECICLSRRKKRNARDQQALSSPGTGKLQLEVLRGPSWCGSKDIGVPHPFRVGSLLGLGIG